jgi:hypothetical protein
MSISLMKDYFNKLESGSEYIEATRLCLLFVTGTMRLQSLISQSNLPETEKNICASLKPKFWVELARRVKAVLASKCVYILSIKEIVTWVRLAECVLSLGQSYANDETLHAKLSKSIDAVLTRYIRHIHTQNLTKFRSAMSTETWGLLQSSLLKRLPTVLPTLFDPLQNAVSLGSWTSPFSDWDKKQTGLAVELPSVEEYDEALLQSHVEEGDEHLFVSPSDSNEKKKESEEKLLLCDLGKLLVNLVDQYGELSQILPENATIALWRAVQSIWRYFVHSIFVFFVEGQINTSDGLARMLKQAKGTIDMNTQPEKESLLDLFQSNDSNQSQSKSNGAVVTLRKRDEHDVDYQVLPTTLSASCDLVSSSSVFGMQARLVAAETIFSVSKALLQLRPQLVNRLHSSPHLKRVAHFFDVELLLANEIRDVLFETTTLSVVKSSDIIRGIQNCSLWLNNDQTANISYLTDLCKRSRLFASHLKKEGLSTGATASSLWSYYVSGAMNALLNGFGSVRKCDDMGRGHMLKHLEMFAAEVAKLTSLRPLPLLERVKVRIRRIY